MVNSVAMNTTNGVSSVAPNMKAVPVSASSVAPVAVPLNSTHEVNLANLVVSVPTASPKGNKRKERCVSQQKLKATAGANLVATNMTNVSSTASNAALSHYKRKSLCLPHFDEIVLKSFSESSNSDCC